MQPGKIWLIFELNTGTQWKSIRPKGFESLKLTLRIFSLYTKTGVSLITTGYRRLPQDTAGSPDIGVFNGIYHIKGNICSGPRGPKAAAPQSDADD